MRTAKSSGQINLAGRWIKRLLKSSAYKDQPTDQINRLSVPSSYPDQPTVKSNRLSEVIGYQNPNVDEYCPYSGTSWCKVTYVLPWVSSTAGGLISALYSYMIRFYH
jgi:hypothetical protein